MKASLLPVLVLLSTLSIIGCNKSDNPNIQLTSPNGFRLANSTEELTKLINMFKRPGEPEQPITLTGINYRSSGSGQQEIVFATVYYKDQQGQKSQIELLAGKGNKSDKTAK